MDNARSTSRRLLATAAVFASVVALAAASAPNAEFLQAQQANSSALREYTWKSRTELALKGEIRNIKLEQVRYDFDGRLQKTPIGGSPEESSAVRRGGPIGKRVAAKKKEEFKELMQELAALAGSYAHLPVDTLQGFARRATVTKGEGRQAGTVHIHGADVLARGDSMSIWVDPASHLMRRVEIHTALEGNSVDVIVDYRSLDNGLTYQARTRLLYPEKQIELTVEAFEYQHVGAAR